jgi:hypothetical protein
MGGKGSAHSVLVGKHEGRRPLARPRHRWEDNIEMYYKSMIEGCGLNVSGSV